MVQAMTHHSSFQPPSCSFSSILHTSIGAGSRLKTLSLAPGLSQVPVVVSQSPPKAIPRTLRLIDRPSLLDDLSIVTPPRSQSTEQSMVFSPRRSPLVASVRLSPRRFSERAKL